ncbi:hypothetical protein LSCM1_05794 [Leishmania martiniquensis]|uniref:Uncharacterized protein n=1 Tax=Leishmania martiniquensis TaxID=1580590 RepID=A0A836KTD8_9TRYP|nr:hypothetical protein LSCM1_05794 [Leishmania martiniquensis]
MRQSAAVQTKDSVAIELKQYRRQWAAMAAEEFLEGSSEDDDAALALTIREKAVIVAHLATEAPLWTA